MRIKQLILATLIGIMCSMLLLVLWCPSTMSAMSTPELNCGVVLHAQPMDMGVVTCFNTHNGVRNMLVGQLPPLVTLLALCTIIFLWHARVTHTTAPHLSKLRYRITQSPFITWWLRYYLQQWRLSIAGRPKLFLA